MTSKLFLLWEKLIGKINSKADLVDGKVPKSQLPDDVGSGGDMVKSVYDTDNNGKVDNADNSDKFGGQLPSYYAPAEHSHATTDLIETLPVGKLDIVDGAVVIAPIGKVAGYDTDKGELVLGNFGAYPIEVIMKQKNTKNYIALPIVSNITTELGVYGVLTVFLKVCLEDGVTTHYIPVKMPTPAYIHTFVGYILYISPFDEYEEECFGCLAGATPTDTIPTANSTNMLTSGAIYTALQDIKTKDLLEYAKKSEIPTIPTKVSAFDNDADYATKEQLKSKADLVDGKVPKEQLPDDIGGGSPSGEIYWKDIVDRPFGLTINNVTILESQSATIADLTDSFGLPLYGFVGVLENATTTEQDFYNNLQVCYDETIYNLTKAYSSDVGVYYFGNGSLLNVLGGNIEDTGEPFVIGLVANEGTVNAYLFITNDTQEVIHTVAILAEGNEIIKTLDIKFIPDTIARKSDVDSLISALSSAIGSGVLE